MDERFATLEAILDRLEDLNSNSELTNLNVDQFHRMQEDQNKRRAVATGFRERHQIETL